ncbi:MAG TPA: hypothetical protein ENI73_02580 [Spirochaetes bacterium]|nr:hypothetical protein [Spirochaetota bacterium]
MKKVITYIRPYELDKTILTLQNHGIKELFIEGVKEYTGPVINDLFLPRIRLQICIHDQEIHKLTSLLSKQSSGFEESEDFIEIRELLSSVDIENGERNIIINQLQD